MQKDPNFLQFKAQMESLGLQFADTDPSQISDDVDVIGGSAGYYDPPVVDRYSGSGNLDGFQVYLLQDSTSDGVKRDIPTGLFQVIFGYRGSLGNDMTSYFPESVIPRVTEVLSLGRQV